MSYSNLNKTDNLKRGTNLQEDKISLIAETSWEVCNKIGGIYAVLSTKARQLKNQFGDRLLFIGPDVWTDDKQSPYFKEKKSLFRSASSKLKLPYGISIRTGRWDIPGSPQVILVNWGNITESLNSFYSKMWEEYGVDSLHAYGDYDESCAFSLAASIVLKELSEYLKLDQSKIVAHYNEWTTGMGLLNTQLTMPKASTVFTTHATSIGRSICGNGKPLYQYFENYNGDQMAIELNMQSKHSLEKAAAHAADCFTTVSEVTARECAQLLDITPQVVTPNGFEPNFVPKTVKYNKLRREGRNKLLSTATRLTGKQYSEDAFIIATSGRNEYRNKGLDLFIDSMATLESKLPDTEQVVAFILVPGWVSNPAEIFKKADTEPTGNSFMTHGVFNADSDNICTRLGSLKNAGIFRKLDIIFVPSYLNGSDGVLDISYYDLLPSFDLTLFPSYYEPWGYTPLESCAFGVPTITTDKAGFGQWVIDNFKNGLRNCGVFVISREDYNYHQSKDEIASSLAEYIAEDPINRSEARHAAFLTAEKADWSSFIEYYNKAFDVALTRSAERGNTQNE